MDNKKIQLVQGEMARRGIDGWLLYDFHGKNDIAVRFLGLKGTITRRSFFLIPVNGNPVAIVHNIEKSPFQALPGDKIYYSSYKILEEKLAQILAGKKRLAMEYSPQGRLPYIGQVDSGTIELIRSLGVDVVTSADLVAKFDACLTAEQIETHRVAVRHLYEIKDAAFGFIRQKIASGETITEYDVVSLIKDSFCGRGLVTEDGPICAVNANAGNPHYEPTENGSEQIKPESLVLIDLWARLDQPRSVYGDISWVAYTGKTLPIKMAENFALICIARDAAVKYMKENWSKGDIYGYQVDDVCRNVISHVDLGNFFPHRTGHSIAESVHGPGPNIDNLETEDRRKLVPGHLFSLEPGLYFEDFGMRTEIDVLITDDGPEITTVPIQEEITLLI